MQQDPSSQTIGAVDVARNRLL